MKILLTAINSKYIHSNYAIRLLKAYAEKEMADEADIHSNEAICSAGTDAPAGCCGTNPELFGKYSKPEIEIAEYTINNLKSQILADIYERQPDCILFSCYIWNWDYVQALCRELPKILPASDLWLGGPEVSYDADIVLKSHPEITGIMIGEGEATFTELAKIYGAFGSSGKCSQKHSDFFKNQLSKIAGLCLPSGYTASRPLLDMNSIPFVYTEENIHDFDHKIIYYESSRGCPFSCSYCLSSVDKNVRFCSNEKTAKELQFFLDHKIPQVKLVDRTFNCSHPHSEFVLQYILDHDNGITNFHLEIAADILSEKELAIMEQMRPGLIQLEIGVQSTNLKTLKEIHRTTNLNTIRQVTERIHRFGNIHQHLDLIAGLPLEDLESFKKSFNEVYAMRPDQFQLGFLKVLKGSYMSKKISDYDLKFTDTAPYEVLSTKWLSFGDCLQLKKIEEMIDVFYNSGQFTYTISVLEKLFASPFEMYEALSTFYEEKDLFIHNPARIARYQFLLEFALEKDPAHADLYKELLTFDMYLRENCKTRPAFATDMKPYYNTAKKLAHNFSENNQKKTKDIAPSKEQRHVDVFSYAVWEAAGADTNWDLSKSGTSFFFRKLENPSFVLFDYDSRSPLNHNASFFIFPVPRSSCEPPELPK